jgi:hypothetical protein
MGKIFIALIVSVVGGGILFLAKYDWFTATDTRFEVFIFIGGGVSGLLLSALILTALWSLLKPFIQTPGLDIITHAKKLDI